MKTHVHSLFLEFCSVSWRLSVFGLSALKQTQHTHTHTHTHPLPPSTCHYQLADTPGSPATAKKKIKMDCYHGNHMVLSWHGRHRHGNSMVIGQAGQEHTQTHTHTHTLFLDNAVSTKLRPTATLQNNTSKVIISHISSSFSVSFPTLCLPLFWINL